LGWFGQLKRKRNNRMTKKIEMEYRDRRRRVSLGNSGWIKNKHDHERVTEEHAKDTELCRSKISWEIPTI
jgi:hypothetical protein